MYDLLILFELLDLLFQLLLVLLDLFGLFEELVLVLFEFQFLHFDLLHFAPLSLSLGAVLEESHSSSLLHYTEVSSKDVTAEDF